MANIKPYMTSDDLISYIKLTMAFPVDQSTYSYNDILTLANQEMFLSAVPSIMTNHMEYFIFKTIIPIVSNISKYAIPNRAIGMTLRDVKYSDANGNFNDMARIDPADKAFFQNNTGVNQVIGKYYLEGNNIVLTPQTNTNPTGNLNFFFCLRPNSLVRNDRACTIQNFVKYLTITDYTQIVSGDIIQIVTGTQTGNQTVYTFTAVTGSPANTSQFQIGSSNVITATNLNTAINASGLTSTVASNIVTLSYNGIDTSFQTAQVVTNNPLTGVIDVDVNNIYINFDQLPTMYTDPDTQVVSQLYSNNCLVDFLQTLPGHRTYNYDVTLENINGTVGKFPVSQLQAFNTNGSGGPETYYPILVGDYICLQNECIIPQIPPELHSALAERTCSRILMGIGDRDGYAVSQQKIAMMDKAKDTMIGTRVEGSPIKVFNRYNLLRMGKRGIRRGYY